VLIDASSQVFFGGVLARTDEVEPNEIKVFAPGGAVGKVEVTVVTRGQIVARGMFEYF
jgi:hypothetical protein